MLNNATAPILYRLIITDDLAGLYYNFEGSLPIIPGIHTKKELLHFAHNLYLEYPIRPLSVPHLAHLLKRHGISSVDKSRTIVEENADLLSEMFSDPKLSILAPLIDARELWASIPSTQLQNAMPDLETFSSAVFFGTFDYDWRRNLGGSINYAVDVGEMQRVVTRMYLGSKITAMCQSQNYGPFCLHPLELLNKEPPPSPASTNPVTRRSFTLHADINEHEWDYFNPPFESSSAPPGFDVNWCFDSKPNGPTSSLDTDVMGTPYLTLPYEPLPAHAICNSLKGALGGRHSLQEAHPIPAEYPLIPINVTAYIPLDARSASRMFDRDSPDVEAGSIEAQKVRRAAAARLEAVLDHHLFHTDVENRVLHPEDHLGIRSIADCPTCPACGWEPLARCA